MGRVSAAVTDRQTRFMVGFVPGGGTDTIARAVAEALRADYPGGIIVENRAGAASRVAVDVVKTAPPDGATLLMTPDFSMTVYPHSFRKLSYDPRTDLVAIAPVGVASIVLCAGPMVPAQVRTAAEYLDLCKSDPKMAVFGSPGAGSSFHFAGLMLGKARGVKLTHIGYKGGAASLQDVVSGQIPANVCAAGEALPFLKAGRLRVLGTFGSERDSFIPDVSTMAEQGIPDVSAQVWVGVFAPIKTSPEMVQRTAEALNHVTSGNALTERLQAVGMRPLTMGSSAFDAMVNAERDRWGPIVKESGFTADD